MISSESNSGFVGSDTESIKIPREDLDEAARLEFRADHTDNPNEAAGLMLMVNHLRTPPIYPVHDDPRTEDNAEGREVLEEFGVITPRTPGDDGWKTLPVRLIHDQGGGQQVEMGPYTLGHRELRVLYRAINVWQQSETRAREFQAAIEAAGWKYNPDDEDPVATLQHYADVVGFGRKREPSSRKARLAKRLREERTE